MFRMWRMTCAAFLMTCWTRVRSLALSRRTSHFAKTRNCRITSVHEALWELERTQIHVIVLGLTLPSEKLVLLGDRWKIVPEGAFDAGTDSALIYAVFPLTFGGFSAKTTQRRCENCAGEAGANWQFSLITGFSGEGLLDITKMARFTLPSRNDYGKRKGRRRSCRGRQKRQKKAPNKGHFGARQETFSSFYTLVCRRARSLLFRVFDSQGTGHACVCIDMDISISF